MIVKTTLAAEFNFAKRNWSSYGSNSARSCSFGAVSLREIEMGRRAVLLRKIEIGHNCRSVGVEKLGFRRIGAFFEQPAIIARMGESVLPQPKLHSVCSM